MNFLNHLMNGFDKKDVVSFSKKIKLHRKTVNEITCIDQLENIDLICGKSSTLIVSVSCFPIMEAQTGIPSIPVNKKENLSVPAFSESLKRYKYEDVSNLELIGEI